MPQDVSALRGRFALFLDRDGVINVDRGYVHRWQDFEFVDGIFELCRTAKQRGYLIIVVTNQSGIGRGYYSEQDFTQLTERMCTAFAHQAAAIDRVYFSATHPEFGLGTYRVDSQNRKPGPGMILQAAAEFELDLARSVLIGDSASDIEAGIAAGVGCNLLYQPLHVSTTTLSRLPTASVRSLKEAGQFIA